MTKIKSPLIRGKFGMNTLKTKVYIDRKGGRGVRRSEILLYNPRTEKFMFPFSTSVPEPGYAT
jgi:hypothetical protein